MDFLATHFQNFAKSLEPISHVTTFHLCQRARTAQRDSTFNDKARRMPFRHAFRAAAGAAAAAGEGLKAVGRASIAVGTGSARGGIFRGGGAAAAAAAARRGFTTLHHRSMTLGVTPTMTMTMTTMNVSANATSHRRGFAAAAGGGSLSPAEVRLDTTTFHHVIFLLQAKNTS